MKALTFNHFVEKARLVHASGLYDYPGQVFVNNKTKIRITCLLGMHEFLQLPSTHLLGKGCRACTRLKKRKTFDQFVADSLAKHSKRFEFPEGIYVDSHTKVLIRCNCCATEFYQKPVIHLNSSGCPTCGWKQAKKNITKSFDSFLEKAQMIHGAKYHFEPEQFVDRKTKIVVRCIGCEASFLKTPNDILNGGGCPHCSTNAIHPDKPGRVYELRCKVTGLSYVGITSNTLRTRLNQHIDAAKRKTTKGPLQKALLFFGRKGFTMTELEQGPAAVLATLETKWISALNTQFPSGYNVGPGGCGLHLKTL